jgi:hypothetical protein
MSVHAPQVGISLQDVQRQPDLMAERYQLACPVVSLGARLHADQAGR